MANIKHNLSRTPIYRIWAGMIRRCENKGHIHYEDYGGRGISVCPRWRNDASAFASDMGPRPEGTTLDRIDNDKGYSPENCRWATRSEQRKNQRDATYKGRKNSAVITFDGESLTVREWSEKLGIPRVTLHKRLRKGYPVEMVLSTDGLSSNQWSPSLKLRKKQS